VTVVGAIPLTSPNHLPCHLIEPPTRVPGRRKQPVLNMGAPAYERATEKSLRKSLTSTSPGRHSISGLPCPHQIRSRAESDYGACELQLLSGAKGT
jgi:hypothetical protein